MIYKKNSNGREIASEFVDWKCFWKKIHCS